MRELAEEGWSGMGCISVRCFNPFPEDTLLPWLEKARRIAILDRSNSFGSVPPLASRVMNALARVSAAEGAGQKQARVLVGGLGGREINVEEMREILLSTHLLFNPPEAWETSLIKKWTKEDATLAALLSEAAALDLRSTNRHTRVPDRLRPVEAERAEFEERLGWLKKAIAGKDYASLLANYHQVEFVAPRELFQETALLQQLVLYLEVRLARHAAGTAKGALKHAFTLSRYSHGEEDQRLARELLQKMAAKGALSPLLAENLGIEAPPAAPSAETAAPPDTVWSQGEPLPDFAETPGKTFSFPFDMAEAELIREILSDLVVLQGERPLFYNPEDYEHTMLRRLKADSRSQLNQAAPPQSAADDAELLWAYQCAYRDVIDRTLQREVLSRHHAPELIDLFEGEGEKRLEELAVRLTAELSDKSPQERRKILLEEMEIYLGERCLPHYPRSSAFYLEYFRNWVAPGIIEHAISKNES